MEEIYAPKHHPVFELTPSLFDRLANDHYVKIGAPVVNSSSFWDIYQALLTCFESGEHLTNSDDLDSILEEARLAASTALNDSIDLIQGLQPYSAPPRAATTGVSEEQTLQVSDFTDSGPDSDNDGPDDGGAGFTSDEATLEVDIFSASVAG